MSILCGIDFSTPSLQAARVAALLAKHLHTPLRVIHAHDHATSPTTIGSNEQALDTVRRHLSREVEQLRLLGADVSGEVVDGPADVAIVQRAEADHALMIVVSKHSKHGGLAVLAGNVAVRIAQTATVPVLVVLDPIALETSTPPTYARWLSGAAPLKIVVGVDFKHDVQPLLDWLSILRGIFPCDICLVHAARLSSDTPGGSFLESEYLYDLPQKRKELLLAQLREKIPSIPGQGALEHKISVGNDGIDRQLAETARSEGADLLVIGAHPRSRIAQAINGLLLGSLMRTTTMSVACIPLTRRIQSGPAPIPRYRRVLAAIDADSPDGHVVSFAVALVVAEAIVHLVHVRREASGEAPGLDHYFGHLRSLVPAEAATKKIEMLFRVLEGPRTADAICSEAERLEVDAVLIGSHASSLFGFKAIGSVTRGVLINSRRPVIVVHEPGLSVS